jgi:hypothetical protein
VEKWIKFAARREGVSPSLWMSNLLSYAMMVESMTKGEISGIVHEFLHLREYLNKQLDFNPFNRFQKNHPEGWKTEEVKAQ